MTLNLLNKRIRLCTRLTLQRGTDGLYYIAMQEDFYHPDVSTSQVQGDTWMLIYLRISWHCYFHPSSPSFGWSFLSQGSPRRSLLVFPTFSGSGGLMSRATLVQTVLGKKTCTVIMIKLSVPGIKALTLWTSLRVLIVFRRIRLSSSSLGPFFSLLSSKLLFRLVYCIIGFHTILLCSIFSYLITLIFIWFWVIVSQHSQTVFPLLLLFCLPLCTYIGFQN